MITNDSRSGITPKGGLVVGLGGPKVGLLVLVPKVGLLVGGLEVITLDSRSGVGPGGGD